MSKKHETLIRELTKLSKFDEWSKVKGEWIVKSIHSQPNGECLCTHNPITNRCILVNINNGNEVQVGSSCVKKFLGIDMSRLFKAMAKYQENNLLLMNKELVAMYHANSVINDWEYSFYENVRKYSNRLSPKQLACIAKINIKAIEFFINAKTNL